MKNSIQFIELTKRSLAIKLALLILLQSVFPTTVFALTGGPSQPEVQSFEPVGTSEMVDLFSGDFNYNIPLLDIDGYPVNISYHSGISMDQESSWVGLGWNINPGVINRSMRGLPDDFSGDPVVKEFNQKANKTWGVTAGGGVGTELVGKKLGPSIDFSLGIKYNNYTGWGSSVSISPGINASMNNSMKVSMGLGISGSSDDGSTIQPSLGLKTAGESNDSPKSSVGASFGGSMNSRQGLKSLSISTTATFVKHQKGSTTPSKPSRKDKAISKLTNMAVRAANSSASFNVGSITYTPTGEMNTKNFSITGKFTVGGELWSAHPHGFLSGFYSGEVLEQTTLSQSSYGYLYSHNGSSKNAIHDFNRENDGAFNEFTPTLGMANYTYDVFSVSGQGVGGSYRSFRSDVGTLYDPAYISRPDLGFTIEGEVGFGNVNHAGLSEGISISDNKAERWEADNASFETMQFAGKSSNLDYEPAYFKEANEKNVESDPAFFNDMGGYSAVNVKISSPSKHKMKAEAIWAGSNLVIGRNKRKAREKRSQLFSYLTKAERTNIGIQPLPVSSYASGAPSHHISEVTNTSTDGKRYVYGLPAYNIEQKEVTFAVGKDNNGALGLVGNCSTGLVQYNVGDNSASLNKRGLDNYYSSTKTPGYAHSYLLTAVLSSDYIDSDNLPGPSDKDLGTYTLFEYDTPHTYKWRTPEGGQNTRIANFNEGMKSDPKDDKASYIYGVKELYYLKNIVSKNHIAVFYTSNRQDGRGVQDEDGLAQGAYMKKLDSIAVFSKKDYLQNGSAAVAIKKVHFVYNYTLCPGVGNNANGGGKLTLTEMYFTYQNSNRNKFSSYIFNYGNTNPTYNLKGYDRWGNYKPNAISTTCTPLDNQYPNSEFPYVDQDTTVTNPNSRAWNLKTIKLPSGALINMVYESDDYSHVQNKKAMQMVQVLGCQKTLTATPEIPPGPTAITISNGGNISDSNLKLYFRLDPGTFVSQYLDGMPVINGTKYLYYKVLANFEHTDPITQVVTDNYEYVPGYAEISAVGTKDPSTSTTPGIGWITLKPVSFSKNGTKDRHPIALNLLQYARLYMPRVVYNPSGVDEEADLENILLSMFNSFASMAESFQNPNSYLYNKDYGKEIISHKSMIRLMNPIGKKLGGGTRVKELRIFDEWDSMSGGQEASYGQTYSYVLEDGKTSSGVAAYEPQIGGEENPWKQPIFYNVEKKFVPDDKFFKEEPIGESFFPSASVGYSRVVVQNLQYSNVTRHATGKTVHEFYTAKDFPTIVSRTDLDQNNLIRHKPQKALIKNILKINSKDYLAASQGFAVELNDMHGKPKRETVYQQKEIVNPPSPQVVDEPIITQIEYKYKSTPYLTGSARLNNECTVIYPNGDVSTTARIGVFFDIVNDAREKKSKTTAYELSANVDFFIVPAPPPGVAVSVPSFWPSRNKEETQFRSIATTKVIQRFGVLEETIASDLGSTVSTKNLAYDSETGEPLLTETTTNFNDKVYTLNYPAYWYHDDMGPGYKNIGYSQKLEVGLNGIPASEAYVNNAPLYYVEGDELSLNGKKAWIVQVRSNLK